MEFTPVFKCFMAKLEWLNAQTCSHLGFNIFVKFSTRLRMKCNILVWKKTFFVVFLAVKVTETEVIFGARDTYRNHHLH